MIGFSTACRRFALLFGSALVLVSFWPFSQSFAQLQTPIVRPENAVSFQQQLDVFDWRYRIGYGRQRTGLGYAIGIDFTTSRTEQPKGFLWKDNQVGYFSLSYLLHRKLMLLGRTQVSNFHDEQSAFNFDRQQAAATVAARWRPFDQLSLQPEIGYRWESRRNFDEHGPYVAFSFQADPFEVDGYRNSAAGLAEITRFPERRNANARINYTVFREFHPGTSDSLTVFYDYYRRDNFFSNPMQGNINSLRKEQRGLRNTLRYKVNEHVVFAQNTTITLGNVALQQIESFRNGARHSHNDYSMTNAIELFWQAHTFSGTVDLETAESTIKYNIPDSAGLSPLSRQLGIIGYDETEKRTKIAQRTRF